MTGSMQRAMSETERRRSKQLHFNQQHNITPKGVVKSVPDILEGVYAGKLNRAKDGKRSNRKIAEVKPDYAAQAGQLSPRELSRLINQTEDAMYESAKNLQFETASHYRDQLHILKEQLLSA